MEKKTKIIVLWLLTICGFASHSIHIPPYHGFFLKYLASSRILTSHFFFLPLR